MAGTATDALELAEGRLAKLAKEADTPDVFFAALLAELEQLTHFRAAAVWGLNHQGIVERVAERIGPQNLPAAHAEVKGRVYRVLELLSSGQASVLTPESREPGQIAVLLTPLTREDQRIGAVEVMLDASEIEQGVEATQATIANLAQHAEAYIARLWSESPAQVSSPSKDNQTSSPETSTLLRLHQGTSVDQTASIIANEGRRLLSSDRVSVCVRSRRSVKVAAVSGRERVAKNSASIAGMCKIAELAFASGLRCRLDPDAETTDSPLHEALADHAAESGALVVEAIPLTSPVDEQADQSAYNTQDEPPVAVLIVEQFTENTSNQDGSESDFLAHTAVAIANAQRHERLAGSLPGRLLERYYAPREWSQARRVLWGVAAGVLMLGLLGVVPAPYRVETRGELAPAMRSLVFAPTDAEVQEVLVTGGQEVKAGQVLLRLSSDRLAAEILSVQNRLQQQRRTLSAQQAEATDPSTANGDTAIRLQGRIAQSEVEIEGLVDRLRELERERSRLEVRAPHAGRVATFDPERTLRQRPVARGKALLEVMEFDGPWRLSLDCPARDAGHVLSAREASADDAPLSVEFVLAMRPENTLQAMVTKIATRAENRPGGVAVVPMEASVERSQLGERDSQLAGGEVVARIHCGNKPLAYVLLGSIYDQFCRVFW